MASSGGIPGHISGRPEYSAFGIMVDMRRNTVSVAERTYDLAVIGGGIFGVCAAWDAVLRGLSVVLLERNDFCGGASANCFKMVHGGIRYIQHGDIARVRSSCAERSAFLRIAPHLVEPLPIIIPTYGHGKKGKALLGAGALAYDLITADRNRGIRETSRRIPFSHFVSRSELLERFPGLERRDLTGGVTIYDGQMYSPPRLVLAFLRSAVDKGVAALNYAEVTGFLRKGERVTGVTVRDRLEGSDFEVRAKCVLNAAGPWSEHLLTEALGLRLEPQGTYSRDACFVVRKRFASGAALAVPGRTRDPDALISREARHLFIVPWRDVNLVGVWHVVYPGRPDNFTVTEQELLSYIDEVNGACPTLELTLDDVTQWNAGLVPFGDNRPGQEHLSYGKRSRLVDHRARHGISGLVTLIGIRYTMGRYDAARAVDRVMDQLGRNTARPRTESLPVHGGDFHSFTLLRRDIARDLGEMADEETVTAVAHNYGAAYRELLPHAASHPGVFAGTRVLRAEVAHAVHEEMAMRLTDVVMRRTELGTAGHPGHEVLAQCADLMAREAGWDLLRRNEELRQAEGELERLSPGA